MKNIFDRFVKDESGATAIEYGLIAALISVALITGATTLGQKLNSVFTGVAGKMDSAETAVTAAKTATKTATKH